MYNVPRSYRRGHRESKLPNPPLILFPESNDYLMQLGHQPLPRLRPYLLRLLNTDKLIQSTSTEPGVLFQACNPSPEEAEAGGLL